MKDNPHFPTGLTVMAGKYMKYAGKYVRGRWQDDNALADLSSTPEKQIGWGFKFDIIFGYTIRPIPKIWKKGFWTHKPSIKDIDDADFEKVFPKNANNIRKVLALRDGYSGKYDVYNPWYGDYWFILRLPRWVPTVFFSINTPWRSAYIGNKAYRIDPFENDMSWTNKVDEDRADDVAPTHRYYALCPSVSTRSHR